MVTLDNQQKRMMVETLLNYGLIVSVIVLLVLQGGLAIVMAIVLGALAVACGFMPQN